MTNLTDAIYTHFTGTVAVTTAIPGGLHPWQAPEGTTTTPYALYQVFAAPTMSNFGTGNHYDSVSVRFIVKGAGHDVVGAAAEVLDANFNDTILSLSTGQCVNCFRLQAPIPAMEPEIDQNGNNVWSWSVTYLYSVRS